MDLEKGIGIASKYVAEYLATLLSTLVSPGARFAIVRPRINRNSRISAMSGVSSFQGTALNPKLLVFVTLSMAVGMLIFDAFPDNPRRADDIVTPIVIAAIWWILSSCLTHLVCKALRGTGSLMDTLSISLQVNSVIFVIAAFLSFMIAAASNPLLASSTLTYSSLSRLAQPFFMYQIISGLLLIVYMPAGLRYVHQFGWGRIVLLGIYFTMTLTLGSIVSLAIRDNIGMSIPREGSPAPESYSIPRPRRRPHITASISYVQAPRPASILRLLGHEAGDSGTGNF